MESHSDWYYKIEKELLLYQDTLNKKEQKKYKLDLLLRVAGRVDSFSTACGECQNFQGEIKGLVQILGELIQIPDKEKRKSYNRTINNIVKHLQKQHKLITKGQYLGMWIGIGVAIGAGLGAALENSGIGPGLGIALGVAIGSYMEKKAKDEGRVI